MSEFKPPNYNLIRYEVYAIKEMSPEGSIIKRLLGKIFNNIHEPYLRNQLFSWYESLSYNQLRNINIIIRKKLLSI